MAEQLSLGCQAAQIAQGLTAVSSHLGLMKGQGLHALGCPSGFCFILQVDCHCKCQPLRMGHIGATVQAMGGGLWKTRSTHQCAGVASSLACSQAFPATPKGVVFPCMVQQHNGSVSYKPPGQDQVCMAAGSNKRTPHMGSPLPGQPSGKIYLPKCRIAWQTPFTIKNLHRESGASTQMW